MTIEEKMRCVINLAEEALAHGELPIAAAVFLGDEMVSSAYTTENAEGRFLVHAEMLALIDADKRKFPMNIRTKLELYTNLEPCMMCLGATMSCFASKVVYALEAPMDGAVDFARKRLEEDACDEIPSYNLPEITSGVLREESKALFCKFAEMNAGKPMYDFAKSLADL